MPENFPECYKNDSLIQTVNSVLLALNNKRNVIIVGENESGLTQIAEWCSYCFNKNKEAFICYCTKNLECSDLIGTQKILDSNEENNELIKFEPRFLYNSIKNGNCVILDSINEAPSRVIERINGLLDKKNKNEKAIFDVPENSEKPTIEINQNFRIICTSNFDKLNEISPSFLNRFEVIVLENQLVDMKDDNIEELVKILCEKYEKEIKNKKVNDNKSKKKVKKKLDNKSEKKVKKKLDIFEKKNKIKNEEIKIDYDSIIKKIIDLSKKNQNIYPNDKEVDENSKKYFTMSSINKFCRTIMILKNKFKKIEKITQKSIINFSFELLFEEHLSSENIEIQNYLFEELKESNIKNKDYEEIYLNKEKYYFAESDSLKKLMIQMYACSLVNQYLCIIGPTGIGKTIGARTFSYIRENIYNNKKKIVLLFICIHLINLLDQVIIMVFLLFKMEKLFLMMEL